MHSQFVVLFVQFRILLLQRVEPLLYDSRRRACHLDGRLQSCTERRLQVERRRTSALTREQDRACLLT